MHRYRRTLSPICATVCLLLSVAGAETATPLDSVHTSTDVTADLAGLVCRDEDVLIDDRTGAGTLASLGLLPSSTDVDAYHRESDGDLLFSLDVTAELDGGLLARPGDVVRFDGSSYALAFEAAAQGLPQGANVDAVGALDDGSLLLSFDTTIDVGGTVVEDEDLVLFDGTGLDLYFDGSMAGVDAAQAVDAAHYLEWNGHLLLSFAGTGTVDGLGFDDEDVLEFDPDADSWSHAYDGSSEHAGWAESDLDALFVVDASAGAVPDGTDGSTPPLTVLKSGGDITLSWSESCASKEADYAVYEGVLGAYASLAPLAPPDDCTTGGATTVTFTPRFGSRFYLVVPQGARREGSYGADGRGLERSPSLAACQPQLIGVCH